MLGDQKSKKTLREVKQKEEVGVMRTFKFKAGTSPSWCQYFWGAAVGQVLIVRAEDWNPLQGSADADSKQARRESLLLPPTFILISSDTWDW